MKLTNLDKPTNFQSDSRSMLRYLFHSLPSFHTLLTISVVLFAIFWNLAATNSLTTTVGTAYVAIAVLTFTAAWVVVLAYGVVWVMRLVERGREEEKQDWVKSAQARSWGR